MSSRDVFLVFTRQKNYLRVKRKYQWVQDARETQQELLWLGLALLPDNKIYKNAFKHTFITKLFVVVRVAGKLTSPFAKSL